MPRRLVLPGLALALGVALLPLGALEPAGTPSGTQDPALRARAQRQARWIGQALAERPLDPDLRLPARAVPRGERGLPPPTEHWLADDAEKSQKDRRKKWMAERHRTPAGVDWKQVERQNGMDQVARRARLAVAADPAVGAWVERGSENQAGRMHAAQVSPDGRTLVAGSSLGGVWTLDLSTEGAQWTPIADALYGGSHWLGVLGAAAEGDPPVVVAATDWGYINVSRDGGASWTQAGLEGNPNEVRRITTTTDGSRAIFIMARGHSGTRLHRSLDEGQSFQVVADLGSYRGDVFVPRDGGGRIHLVTGAETLASDDLGETWQSMGPSPGGAEANLAGSEAGAPTLYAIVDDARLWRSDDAGGAWQDMGQVADFWGRLSASIVDPALVAWGGFEFYRSYDGGQTHLRIHEWHEYYNRIDDRLHADIMGIEVAPDGQGGEAWLIGTDGGLYRSTDGLTTVENLSLRGLRVSQYYDTLTHVDDAESIAAGSQDQGYQVATSLGESGRFDFDQVLSGDYAHLVSTDGSHELVYSVYPGFILVQIGEAGDQLGYVEFPAEESGQYYAWLPPLEADPADPSAFFFCSTRLYRYTFDGETWKPEQWSDEQFARSSYEFLSALRFAPSDPTRAYAATSAGRLFTSDDGGVTWEESDDEGPDSHYFHGTAIQIDPEDPDTAWVGGAGYDGDAVYMTTDGGQSWKGWGDGLPSTLVYDLAMATDGSRRIFAGTETSAWVRGPDDDVWVDVTGGAAPITIYWSVEALQTEPTMRFGTYGRGIWDLQYTPMPPPDDGEDDTGDGGGDGPDTPGDGGDGPEGCGCAGATGPGGRVSLTLLPLTLLPLTLVALRRRRTDLRQTGA